MTEEKETVVDLLREARDLLEHKGLLTSGHRERIEAGLASTGTPANPANVEGYTAWRDGICAVFGIKKPTWSWEIVDDVQMMVNESVSERDAAVARSINLVAEVENLKGEMVPVADFALEAFSRLDALADKYEKRGRESGHGPFGIKASAIREAVEVVRGVPGWNGDEHMAPSAYVLRDKTEAEIAQLTKERDELRARLTEEGRNKLRAEAAEASFARRRVTEAEDEIAQLTKERDLLFDALNLHMRSTGITKEAMDRVEAFRVVIADSKERVRGEMRRLENGWNDAADKKRLAEAEVARLIDERDEDLEVWRRDSKLKTAEIARLMTEESRMCQAIALLLRDDEAKARSLLDGIFYDVPDQWCRISEANERAQDAIEELSAGLVKAISVAEDCQSRWSRGHPERVQHAKEALKKWGSAPQARQDNNDRGAPFDEPLKDTSAPAARQGPDSEEKDQRVDDATSSSTLSLAAWSDIAEAFPGVEVVTDEQGVLRFKEDKLVCFLVDSGQVDLNRLAADFSTGRFDGDAYMRFYRGLGYSLAGFDEMFVNSASEDRRAAFASALERARAAKGGDSMLRWVLGEVGQ